MKKKIYVFAAQGAEEIECLTQVDLLRRAGFEVVLTAIGGDRMGSVLRQMPGLRRFLWRMPMHWFCRAECLEL